jgi:hypothetical protein
MPDPASAGQHPGLRICPRLRGLLGGAWDTEAWQQIRLEVPKALAEKTCVERTGCFN